LLGLHVDSEDGSDVTQKCRLTFIGLHGVISQNTEIFIVTSIYKKLIHFWTSWEFIGLQEVSSGSACYLLHAAFMHGLLFGREDGGDIFLRNIYLLSTDYTALYPRK
jgi:hypothetical protein